MPEDEVPITSITNGIHTRTWMAPEFTALYDKYLPGWEEHLTEPEFWTRGLSTSRTSSSGPCISS